MGFFSRLFDLFFGSQTITRQTYRSIQDEPDFSAPDPLQQADAGQANITGSGDFEFEVVGESKHQRNLSRICGGKTEEGHDLQVVATLVLEDSNQYDPKAVRVDVAGLTVGYLPRETARKYRRQLAKAGHPTLNATCLAIIRGGWDRGEDDAGHFGVVVDLPDRW